MPNLSMVRNTTKDPLTRNLTQEQVAYRLAHGHPSTGQALSMHRGPAGGVFYAVKPYSPGDYYLSTGDDKSPPHEPWGYDPAPVKAKRPLVRRKPTKAQVRSGR